MTLPALATICSRCQKCSLADSRKKVVFGGGDADADILIVGDVPALHEGALGRPFFGRSGTFLDEMLELIDLNRHENIYITNVIKCPLPKNRSPLHTEQRACLPYLHQQIDLIAPKFILCLGQIPATLLIDPNFSMEDSQGIWFGRDDIQITALHHPTTLLQSPQLRVKTFESLKSIRHQLAHI